MKTILLFVLCSLLISCTPLLNTSAPDIVIKSQTITNTTSDSPADLTLITVNPDLTISPTATFLQPPKLYYWHSPGEVFTPILLYHHVSLGQATNAYAVSSEQFRDQIEFLKKYQYQTITASLLVKTIVEGAEIPQKPIVITFDDGNENVFLNAYPIMKEYGYIGVIYLIVNRLNTDGYLTTEQIKELISAGWEVGDHSMTHIDLVKNTNLLRDEIGNSKHKLEDVFGIKVLTFAYPFGNATRVIKDWVKRIGYSSGMGLGITNVHSQSELFFLSRREVSSQMTLKDFENLIS
jgi:peptidoglycan/xylan/chitin deacetylase (PgdA/CDA1 family)